MSFKKIVKNNEFLKDIFFPKFCFGCGGEKNYLCADCKEIIDISRFHQKFSCQNIDDLYFSLDYQKNLTKKLIQSFKYRPFIKELGKTLSWLIINHFQLIDNNPDFSKFHLVPVPLSKKRLKWRGYNQAELIAKELALFFQVPLLINSLLRIKETIPQTQLSIAERKNNLKDAFLANKSIEGKNILLIDDIYTSGATMQECAKTLKTSGAKKIIGIVVARG